MSYNKVWEVMNDLEMVTSKICSAREIIDVAAESIQRSEYDKAETLAMAAYEFLGYYLQEFDDKFKKAWKETVVAEKELLETTLAEKSYYEGWDCDAAGAKFPLSCDKDDKSPECQKSWNDFWEENYYPEEHQQYTEEELNAMCDKAASDQEKDKCREYNLREAEYYNKRAQLDINYEKMKEEISRNDSTRLKYEDGWVYESPDGGKTVTKRKVGSTEKTIVKADGYSTSEPSKKWVLPVEVVRDEDTDKDEYCVAFPDDLLEAANLKEDDEIEWVDRGDGSYLLRKVTQPLRMDEC